MGTPRGTFDCGDICGSMAFVELDDERDRFQAAYDNEHDSTSMAVVAAVATALDRDPLDLSPLHTVVDTGALGEVFSDSSGSERRNGSVSFTYEGFDVTVSSDGQIEIVPVEAP